MIVTNFMPKPVMLQALSLFQSVVFHNTSEAFDQENVSVKSLLLSINCNTYLMGRFFWWTGGLVDWWRWSLAISVFMWLLPCEKKMKKPLPTK